MKHKSLKPRKADLRIKVCLNLDKDLLDLLHTLIPNYKRSDLVCQLLKEYINKHLLDQVNTK